MKLFLLAATWLIYQAFAIDNKFIKSYDTALQKKCELLKMKHPAAFVGDRCFAATAEKYSVKIGDWKTLHSKCNHLNGYTTHAAHIWSEKQLDVLLEQDVLQNSERYFIGARQSPTDTEENIPCCKDPRHSERWHYFDENDKIVGALNADLWLKDQPDNAGSSPPEFAVTLEKLSTSHKLGFNDANPEMNQFAVLCEYVDYLKCPEGWTLVEFTCFKVFTDGKTYPDAAQSCRSQPVGSPGLAAIHNDKTNQRLAMLAYEAFNFQRSGSGEQSHNPVAFGLVFRNGGWMYDIANEKVDFFRWYHKAGMGEPTPFMNRNNMVAMLNTYPSGDRGESKYTYWTVADGSMQQSAYICQGDPIVQD